MSETAILDAARASVATALPTAKDWSDDPSDVRADKLDAYVVTLVRDGSEPASMASTTEDVQMTLEVEVFTSYKSDQPGRTLAGNLGRTARDALKSDAALAALCYRIQGAGMDVDIAPGETRYARATVTLSLSAEF